MLRMHIISKVKWRRGGWGLPSIIIYLEEIIFNNNNNNHLESWVVPLQSREEFSRWGLLPPILGGISNLVILQTPALPNPRYPALPHQDTSYTWTMVDHCYQLWPLITSLPGYSPNCKDQVSGKNHDFSIGSRSAFWWVGHENRFSATIDHFFNKDFTREVAPDFFWNLEGPWGGVRKSMEL